MTTGRDPPSDFAISRRNPPAPVTTVPAQQTKETLPLLSVCVVQVKVPRGGPVETSCLSPSACLLTLSRCPVRRHRGQMKASNQGPKPRGLIVRIRSLRLRQAAAEFPRLWFADYQPILSKVKVIFPSLDILLDSVSKC